MFDPNVFKPTRNVIVMGFIPYKDLEHTACDECDKFSHLNLLHGFVFLRVDRIDNRDLLTAI